MRRVVTLLGVWVALVGSALLLAGALDSPVGEGARDEAAPAAVGQVEAAPPAPATPAEPDAPGTPGVGTLPPFAMVLDRPLPAGVAGLAPDQQAEELRARAMRTRDPERFVELGSVLQVLGDRESAEFSYRSALKIDPGNLAAEVGLAVVDGGAGPAGLARGAARLEALADSHPDAQLVGFNQGWVALYRERPTAARDALKRTVALGPATRLGRTATALLTALEQIRFSPAP